MAKINKRIQELTKYINKNKTGIEIAPYFNPVIPKRDGNKVLIVDVIDEKKLRDAASLDPFIPNERLMEIEDVDFVGDASNIADLISKSEYNGSIEYIVSSHNFEHLPNPIKFLSGCAEVLVEGGYLSMAIPDYRACFDHFRYPTRLSDWLRAYHEDYAQPSAETVFDGNAAFAFYYVDGEQRPACDINNFSSNSFVPNRTLKEQYENYNHNKKNTETYIDSHCSTVFNKTFELMVRDLIFLGILDFEIVEISETKGHEFFVHLKKIRNIEQSDDKFYTIRERLLRDVNKNLSPSTSLLRKLNFKSIIRFFLGPNLYAKAKSYNSKRRAGRH